MFLSSRPCAARRPRVGIVSAAGLAVLILGAGSASAQPTAMTSLQAAEAAKASALVQSQALVEDKVIDDGCIYATSIVVTYPGDSETYAMDPATGEVSPTSVSAVGSDCGSKVAAAPGGSAKEGQSAAAGSYISNYSKTFTSGDRNYSKDDANSQFEAQYGYSSTLPVAFKFYVSPALVAISTGNVTKATATRNIANCHYNKVGVSPAYQFHFSCPSHSFGTNYVENGVWSFPIVNNGTATITWAFSYRILSV